MNSRYERENDLQDLHGADPQDREISLGTTTILGIFFALALLCAVFFGFGYSLGRHSAPPVPSASEAAAEPEGSGSKPASGSPLNQAHSAPATHTSDTSTDVDSTAEGSDKTQQEGEPEPVRTVVSPSAVEPRSTGSSKASATRPPAAANLPGAPVVQVAAVSHQGDADILATALKQRGYNVSIRQAPQDKLLHVQVGPFASKKEAETMRQRLQADGYNAIVK